MELTETILKTSLPQEMIGDLLICMVIQTRKEPSAKLSEDIQAMSSECFLIKAILTYIQLEVMIKH